MSRTTDPCWQRTRTRLSEVRRSCTELLHRFAEDPADEAGATASAPRVQADRPSAGGALRPRDTPPAAPIAEGQVLSFEARSRTLQDMEVSA